MNYAGSAGAARSAVVCLNVQLLIQAREAHSHLSRVCLGGLGSVVLQGIPFDARVFVFLYMPFFHFTFLPSLFQIRCLGAGQ